MRKSLIVCSVLLAFPCIALATPLPDTGQTKCYNNSVEITCPNPGEDFYGQDAQYITNPQSYTKLDANGNDLPNEATEWVMVRDNVTGLIWEVKTDDGSIHDKDNLYNWYDAQDVFISVLNSGSFGGYSDWRLPTIKELITIVNRNNYGPSIDTPYFPHTMHFYSYWSSTTVEYYSLGAWKVLFDDGTVAGDDKSTSNYTRGVRGQVEVGDSYVDNGNETVTDTETGLMWQKDTAPGIYTWESALHYCDTLSYAGFDDWRLPNINELSYLVDYAKLILCINTQYFPNTLSDIYWSSTSQIDILTRTWVVYFAYGEVFTDGKYFVGGYYVRAVRGGLCGALGDSDKDTVCNDADSCIYDYNLFQIDCDNDGVGDICDPDTVDPDGDGVDVACDNCPSTPSENQSDTYPPQGNGIGDACDCEGNFNCDADSDVDGSDAALFKGDFGRSVMVEPCTGENPCNGDFNCDGDVDGTDASLFKQDFGRSSLQNPCPACVSGGAWCEY